MLNLNLNFLAKFKKVANNAITSPKKRKANKSSLSSNASQLAVEPSSTPFQSKPIVLAVKTARPDITVGLLHETVLEALAARGLGSPRATLFLKVLQMQQVLYSNPTQHDLPIRFPTMVIEGKSYATGKPVFEAQNQAAVSGSCMIKLQQDLADLARLHLFRVLFSPKSTSGLLDLYRRTPHGAVGPSYYIRGEDVHVQDEHLKNLPCVHFKRSDRIFDGGRQRDEVD